MSSSPIAFPEAMPHPCPRPPPCPPRTPPQNPMTPPPSLARDIDALADRLGGDLDRPRRARRIYCNRDLNMERVRWVGFDMDYTLAIYRRDHLDALVHRLALERLAQDGRWDPGIADIPFDPDFAIRGLVMDRQEGHLLKMDRYRHVGIGYHGLRQLDEAERAVYRNDPPQLWSPRYQLIDTLFELPEAYLYCALIDHHERRGLRVDYAELADTLRHTVDSLHADDSLKRPIIADLDRYILPDPHLASTLHRLRSGGKRLFLMTNSFAPFTEAVMQWLLGRSRRDYPDWTHYFDVIITGASKPDFFGRGAPFLEVDRQGNTLQDSVSRLLPGRIHQGGNIHDLERSIGLAGDAILYVGDHIYGDILRSKRDSLWRTCMVIPELEDEIRRLDDNRDGLKTWDTLEERLHTANDRMGHLLVQEERLRTLVDRPELAEEPEQLERARALLHTVEHRLQQLRRRRAAAIRELLDHERHMESRFHPRWGSLLKKGNEASLLGQQVDNYACIYTSRVSNFATYSPSQYFHSPRVLLPHEIEFEADRLT
ncbi:MAG: HAD family hydrolase [Deltaproteobacteria bacterium]|nr:MAG: HAD family hydrolase [Deltaproteobacteria bacterium]